MIKKVLKQFIVRKTVRLTRQVYAYSAREAILRCDFLGNGGAVHTTKGWWCRKNRKERRMKNKVWKCPKHKVPLQSVEDYPGALVHKGCSDIFAVVDGYLCVLDGNRWQDVETKEYREVK